MRSHINPSDIQSNAKDIFILDTETFTRDDLKKAVNFWSEKLNDFAINSVLNLVLPPTLDLYALYLVCRQNQNGFCFHHDQESPQILWEKISLTEAKFLLLTEKKFQELKNYLEKKIKDTYVINSYVLIEFKEYKIEQGYYFFSSGTGLSVKAAFFKWEALNSFEKWVQQHYQVQKPQRLLNVCSWGFDIILFDLIRAGLYHSPIYYLPRKYFVFPHLILEYIKKQQINEIQATPSFFQQLIKLKKLTEIYSLKKIFLTGETFGLDLLQKLNLIFPKAEFYNLYGQTETNSYLLTPLSLKQQDIPLGNLNSEFIQIDSKNQEIIYSGPTKLCFQKEWKNNLIVTTEFPANMPFRTQDIVEIKNDQIFFKNRATHNIKIAGHQFNLEHLEFQLSQTLKGKIFLIANNNKIHAVSDNSNLSLEKINQFLLKLCGSKIQIQTYQTIPCIPMTINGKVDRERIKLLT